MQKPGRRGPIRTSDHIADDLISLLANPSDPRIGSDWLLTGQEFKHLVKFATAFSMDNLTPYGRSVSIGYSGMAKRGHLIYGGGEV
jgi:hypothetical protein